MATIKAGTYRFNDVLTETLPAGEYPLNFTWSEGLNKSIYISFQEGFGYYLHFWGVDNSYPTEIRPFDDSYEMYITSIVINEEQEISDEFYTWFTANAVEVVEKTPVASITHNGEVIASLHPGQTATLKCAGMKMATDVVVEVAENIGGGICDKLHIIEVDSLPTENMDSTAIYRLVEEQPSFEDMLLIEEAGGQISSYKELVPYEFYYAQTRPEVGNLQSFYYIEDENKVYLFDINSDGWVDLTESFAESGITCLGIIDDVSKASNENIGYYIVLGTEKKGDFYIYNEPEFRELYLNFLGGLLPLGALGSQNGLPITLHYVGTTPQMEDILPSVEEVEYHFYYVEDLNDVYILVEGEWKRLVGDNVIVEIVDELPNEVDPEIVAMYALVTKAWRQYLAPRGNVNIIENGKYDVASKNAVIVDVPNAAVNGTWFLNETLDSVKIRVDHSVNFTFTDSNGVVQSGVKIDFNTLIDDTLDYSYLTDTGTAVENVYDLSWRSESYRTIDFGTEPQIVPSEFKEWLEANATRVESGGGGECDKPHIVEVDTLPTENIDENAVYRVTTAKFVSVFARAEDTKVISDLLGSRAPSSYNIVKSKPTSGLTEGAVYYVEDDNEIYMVIDGEMVTVATITDPNNAYNLTMQGVVFNTGDCTANGYYAVCEEVINYHTYANEVADIVIVSGGSIILGSEVGFPLVIVPTIPTEYDESHIYYVEDRNDLFIMNPETGELVSYSSVGLTNGGIVTDENDPAIDTTVDGYYILANVGWTKYLAPTDTLTITENGTYDVTNYVNATVNVPATGGSGECSGTHVIEVTELPAENIDENAVYLCEGSYYKYGETKFLDYYIYIPSYGLAMSYNELAAEEGIEVHYHIITTETTGDILESVEPVMHLYWVVDENVVGYLMNGEFTTMPVTGVVADISEISELGYYIVGTNGGWEKYIAPTGTLTITEAGTYDVTEKSSVVAKLPDTAVDGVWQFNLGCYRPSTESGGSSYGTHIEYVNFTTTYNGESKSFIGMKINSEDIACCISYLTDTEEILVYENYNSVDETGESWLDADCRTVDFGDDPQLVFAIYRTWLVANTTRNEESGEADPVLQEKTATENGTVTPDSGYDGLSQVTVNVPIPDGYVQPTGTKEITENGTYDVTNYANATINVESNGLAINGIIEQYRVNAGATVNAGDFVEFVNKFGSGTFHSATTSNLSVCKLDNNRVLAAYTDGGNSSRCTAVAISIEDGIVSVGNEIVLSDGRSDQCSVAAASHRRAIVVYFDYDASDYENNIYTSALTIDGTTITETTNEMLVYADARAVSTVALEAGKVLVATCDGEYSYYWRMFIYEIDEDTAVCRSVYYESGSHPYDFKLIKINDGQVLIFYRPYYSSTKVYKNCVSVIGVDGTTVSVGDRCIIGDDNASFTNAVLTLEDGRLLHLYDSYAEILTVSGNGVTRGTRVLYKEVTANAGAVALNENQALAYYGGKAKVLTVVGDSITIGPEYDFGTISTSRVNVIPFSDSSAFVVFVGNNVGKYTSLSVDGDTVTAEETKGGTLVQPATSRLQNVGVAATGGAEGEIVNVYVVKQPYYFFVAITAPNATITNSVISLPENEPKTLNIEANSGYQIDSLQITGCEYTWDESTGELVLFEPTGNVEITVGTRLLFDGGYSATQTTSGASLTASVDCAVGDLVVAAIATRDTLTVSDGWTLVSTSGINSADTTGNGHRLSWAYKFAGSTTESITVTQASAQRLYINMVALAGATGVVDNGYSYVDDTTSTSITVTKPEGLVLWGMTAPLWSTAVPYGSWTASNDMVIVQLGDDVQQRLGIGLDQSDDASVTFKPAATAPLTIGCLSVQGIDKFY